MTSTVSSHKLATNAVCTIVSKNYFAYARTLIASYIAQHPADRCYILVVDKATERSKFTCTGATVLFLEDLDLPDWRKIAFKFDIMELNTNVKPSFLKFVLAQGHKVAVYLDPDIFVYHPITPVHDALAHSNIVLTPHALAPLPEDGLRPLDRDLLKAGAYNLGFIGLKNSGESMRFLTWWEERCLRQGFNEPSMGWFVDQHWIDLVPAYFNDVLILKHPGCNVAYWNLHERHILEGDEPRVLTENRDVPLIFFHYSGIDATDPESLSKHQNRFNLTFRSDVSNILKTYASKLLYNDLTKFKLERYGFDNFDTGERIPTILRRYYAEQTALYADDDDPFLGTSKVHHFALLNRLLRGGKNKNVGRQVNAINITEKSKKKLIIIGFFLRMTLRLLGPIRFEMLCKFMRYYGVPNNQSSIMFSSSRRSA